MKKGKRFSEILKKVDSTKVYPLSQAISLVKSCASAKFVESFELVIILNLDKKKADQSIRGVAFLPHGIGKKVRIAAFVDPTMVESAKKAGADFAGEDLIEKVSKGFIDFDYAIADHSMMPALAKLGRILGPKGLMPNPKMGTVSKDVIGAISSFKNGMVKFKSDSECNVHVMIGKVNFEDKFIEENAKKVVEEIRKERPKEISAGGFVRHAVMCSTMGVGIRVDVLSLL